MICKMPSWFEAAADGSNTQKIHFLSTFYTELFQENSTTKNTIGVHTYFLDFFLFY